MRHGSLVEPFFVQPDYTVTACGSIAFLHLAPLLSGEPNHEVDGTGVKTLHSHPHHAPIAQLDRVLVSETKGRRFDSCWARHLPMPPSGGILLWRPSEQTALLTCRRRKASAMPKAAVPGSRDVTDSLLGAPSSMPPSGGILLWRSSEQTALLTCRRRKAAAMPKAAVPGSQLAQRA